MSNTPFRLRLARLIAGRLATALTVSAQVDDSPGWTALTTNPHDYDPAKLQEIYADALTAWRNNPIAWRIIAITTDYTVGDRIQITSNVARLQKFISEFWNHPQNHINLRLDEMSDELARAGDLFAVLFRNKHDGMSYLRFVTKDRIVAIETAPNDWEHETAYTERLDTGETRTWISPQHPDADAADAIMLHYCINRPIGALFGESDLTTLIPWLQRYSRMLEDRIRLHWAVKAFLWFVTVPTDKVDAKREAYRQPPETGSVIVKDPSETWEVSAPSLQAADATHDLRAVRGMIDAGSGYPPHWRGEAADANLATATAMQSPTERHLTRRQTYFVYILEDLLYHAYQRAARHGSRRPLNTQDFSLLFTAQVPDVSRSDNEALARAGKDLASALTTARSLMLPEQPTLTRLLIKLLFQFIGEPQPDETLTKLMNEITANPLPEYEPGAASPSPSQGEGRGEGESPPKPDAQGEAEPPAPEPKG